MAKRLEPASRPAGGLSIVDLVVFLTVGAFFGHSLFKLFGDWDHMKVQSTELSIAATAQADGSEARSPASITVSSFANVEYNCEGTSVTETKASRIRLSGPLCQAPESAASDGSVVKTEITNQSNQISATVFTDTALNRFLTDYLPLAGGDNEIQFKFIYRDGKSQTKEIKIKKI